VAENVMVVDDQEVVRRGLVVILEQAGMRVAGEADNGTDAVRMARKLKPGVVLLDVRLRSEEAGSLDGFEVLSRIRAASPKTRVIMFSAFDNPTYLARALAAGAFDYLVKGSDAKMIRDAVKGAVDGHAPLQSGPVRKVAGTMANQATVDDLDIPLTPRESQVLRQISLGLSNKEIALALAISVETVKEHVQNLLRKLAVSDRTQAAVWAIRHGLE
jgi:DNA-binding NarL/FixJ family response regulator